MATDTRSARVPEVIAPGSGHHLHFLNHLATIKVRAGAHGALTAVEFTAPRGFGPPLHRHDDEDELCLVHEGELAFHTGDQAITGQPGAIALLPQGIAHTFQVLSETARFTCVTASRMGVPRFDQMVASLGIPTDDPVLPQPGHLDATHIADVCLRHGIEIVGPPPEPLP